MNPMTMMKITAALQKFKSTHPKFTQFLMDVPRQTLKEGAIVEITITDVDGKTYSSNMRVRDTDVELYHTLKELREN